MFLLNSNRDELRKILQQVFYRSNEMVTTVPSALCFWICALLQKFMDSVGIFVACTHCIRGSCLPAGQSVLVFHISSDSLPDGLFSFFISVARSSKLLHDLPSCFPRGSNSHRTLRSSLSVPKSPRSSSPAPTVKSQELSVKEDATDALKDAHVSLATWVRGQFLHSWRQLLSR